MTLVTAPDAATSSASHHGPLGRLGTWVIEHRRVVTAGWLLVIIGLGAFAPGVESSLSGAGWQADHSESVAWCRQVQKRLPTTRVKKKENAKR
jgi:RND superfamily putative drug exporter